MRPWLSCAKPDIKEICKMLNNGILLINFFVLENKVTFHKNMYVYISQAFIVIFKWINFPALISNMINTDRYNEMKAPCSFQQILRM